MPFLPRPRRDARPLQPVLERVLAERNEDAVGSVEHDVARLVGEVPPRDVDRAAVGAEHLVEDRERDLRVHQVAVRRRDPERALAKRLRWVGDEELRVEPVLDAEPLARGARALAVEGEEPARGPDAARGLAEARVEEAEEVPDLGHRADRGAGVREVCRPGRRRSRGRGPSIPRISGRRKPPANWRAYDGISSRKRRCPSREERVEGERRLAGAGDARDDGQAAARDGEVEAREVVLARPADDDHRFAARPRHGAVEGGFPELGAALASRRERTPSRVGRSAADQPPPSAWTRFTVAVIRRVCRSTAVRSFAGRRSGR